MKYYIRGFFGDWKQVSEEKFKEYRKHFLSNIVTSHKEVVNDYCKIIDEK